MESTRRLASIMFTDIVGYSRLMSDNEPQALEVVRLNKRIHKELIEKHRGEYLKDLGDGTLAMFETAQDSVECALELQRTVKQFQAFQIRIGIHLGDITIEEHDVYGDGVNIASRIQSLTDPGGIYISESVYKTIEGKTKTEVKDFGEVRLKNIRYPQRIFALIHEGLPYPKYKPPMQKGQAMKFGALSILIVAILVWAGIRAFTSEGTTTTGKRTSIAVLPFDSFTADTEDQDFLTDGLHDAVISKLSQITDLRVISRTSTLRYKDSDMTIPEIAEELKVDNILEASLTGNDESFRINAKLVKAKPEENLWNNDFRKETRDLISIQDEIAISVGKILDCDISGIEEKSPEIDLEIYKVYLRGMHLLEKGEPEDMLRGIEILEEAVDLDPTAAFVHSGLAQGYVILGHSPIGEPEHFLKARAAAKQSIQLDSKIAEAYAALADVQMYYEWDYESAGINFRNAIQLKPSLAEAHAHYTWLNVIYNDWEKAIEEAHYAVEVDPFSTIYTGWLGWLYWWAGDNENAILYAQKTLELNQNSTMAYMILGSALADDGKFQEAIKALETAVEKYPRWAGHLARVYHMSGNKKKAVDLLNLYKDDPYFRNRDLVNLYAGLHMREETLEYMRRSVQSRSRMAPWFMQSPHIRFLHGDPEFIELCRAANIPERIITGTTIQAQLLNF